MHDHTFIHILFMLAKRMQHEWDFHSLVMLMGSHIKNSLFIYISAPVPIINLCFIAPSHLVGIICFKDYHPDIHFT